MSSPAWESDEVRGGPLHARPALVVAGVIAASCVLTVLAAPRLRGAMEKFELVPAAHPYVRLDREVNEEFGFANPVVWVIEARDGSVWTPELLGRLQQLTRDVLRIPNVVSTDLISLASPNLRDLLAVGEVMRPVYLMERVPQTPGELAALRGRVEADPLYRGTLVSEDGRAAMVVANFRHNTDPVALGTAARVLRDRYRDAQANVYVAGGSIAATMTFDPVSFALILSLVLIAGAALMIAVPGVRASLQCGVAAVLGAYWAVAALVAADLTVLPWSAQALPIALLVGASTALAARADSLRLPATTGIAAVAACGVAALLLDPPARAFAVAGGAGGLAGTVAAVFLGGASAGRMRGEYAAHSKVRTVVAACVGLAAVGSVQLRSSFGVAGYGERYLPGDAGDDVRAIARCFALPSQLAVLVSGQPGFVASPEVLGAFDGVVQAVRRDPSVSSAISIADIVKLVHRAFNEGEAEYAVVPDDRGLVARYLALSYSPGFRRFVDRSLARAAIWVSVRGDDRVALRRVEEIVRAQLSRQPAPGAQVELFAGDGAVALAASELAIHFAAVSALAVLIVAAVYGGLAGVRHGTVSLAAAGIFAAIAAGCLGWSGVPVDLVSLPLLAAAAIGVALTAPRLSPNGLSLAAALGVMGAILLTLPYAGTRVVGAVLLGVAAGWLCVGPQRDAA